MQPTTSEYKEIIQAAHRKDLRVYINDVLYSGDDIVVSIDDQQYVPRLHRQLYNGTLIGGTCSAEFDITILPKASIVIPKRAEVRPEIAVCNSLRCSEFIPLGVFYISTRKTPRSPFNILQLHCVDAMLKSEQDFISLGSEVPPWDNETMRDVAGMCADMMEVELDNPEDIGNTAPYVLSSPPIGYSVRQVLACIAISHAGNFVMTVEGKLRLVPWNSAPSETNLLVTERGEALVFGGDRIVL